MGIRTEQHLQNGPKKGWTKKVNHDAESNANGYAANHRRNRRELLKSAGTCVGAAAMFSILGNTSAMAAAKEADLPQPGDVFLFYDGPKEGQPVALTDLVADAPPVVVRAKDPATGADRDEEGNGGIVLVLRVKPEAVPPEFQETSAQGVLAYSAWCTHLGCVIDTWDPDKKVFRCPCHKSAFDPMQGGKVMAGPATRDLPSLPVKIEDDKLLVAGEFSARVGPQRG